MYLLKKVQIFIILEPLHISWSRFVFQTPNGSVLSGDVTPHDFLRIIIHLEDTIVIGIRNDRISVYKAVRAYDDCSGRPGSIGGFVCFQKREPLPGVFISFPSRDPVHDIPHIHPYGHGPQGDAIRIYNFVRCVRDGS